MRREIPHPYRRFLSGRRSFLGKAGEGPGLSLRGFWTGTFLSFFLAVGAPYVRLAMRATPMAFDFDTPGAIFLFLVVVGLLNVLYKLARSRGPALGLALLATAAFISWHWPLFAPDLYDPGVVFVGFLVASSWVNLPLVWSGRSLVLSRADLVLVYVMLLVVSALCSLGMTQQLLPAISGLYYFASPENKWLEKLVPHLPGPRILVDDGNRNQAFHEGLGSAQGIDYAAWIEPFCWWAVLLLALYVVMVSVAVILRRQWMERERLPYPLIQVSVAFVAREDPKRLVNGLFRRPAFWCGVALPMFFGSLLGLQHYDAGLPAPSLRWTMDFFGQPLRLFIRFSLIGFSYLIHTQVAAGVWVFHLLSKLETSAIQLSGVPTQARLAYSVNEHSLLAYQGGGALVAMVLLGLWTARDHVAQVFGKAFGRAPEIDDGDEIMSYRSAVAGLLGGSLAMVAWLAVMGTPLWVAGLLIVTALIVFIGLTRIIAEAGLAAVRTAMTAPDMIVHGLGSSLLGPSGVFNLYLAHVWCADLRIFLMALVANGLKLIEDMDRRSRRLVFGAIVLAIDIGAVGSCWMTLHLAYVHGSVNLDAWRGRAGPIFLFDGAARGMEPTGVSWSGLTTFAGGGAVMLVLTWLRHRLPWWPLHPIGFPIGANYLMNHIWFSVFIAWIIKVLVLRFGGANLYRSSQVFFLGLIAGEALGNGMWLVIDYFTGSVGNYIYGIDG